jgi:hypothetical protein
LLQVTSNFSDKLYDFGASLCYRVLFNIFLELIFILSVLSMPSVSVTTALVTITSGPPPAAVSQALIGYSYVSALGACEFAFS